MFFKPRNIKFDFKIQKLRKKLTKTAENDCYRTP